MSDWRGTNPLDIRQFYKGGGGWSLPFQDFRASYATDYYVWYIDYPVEYTVTTQNNWKATSDCTKIVIALSIYNNITRVRRVFLFVYESSWVEY